MKSTLSVNQILHVEHLSVATVNGDVNNELVHDVSFDVAAGEMFAVVGESGSGKTTLACALTRLLPPKTMHVSGSVLFGGQDILATSKEALQTILRSEIRHIFQEPGQSLNPIARIATQTKHILNGDQLSERRYVELCAMFGLGDHHTLASAYPHQLSIGTLQRILLALALAPGPRLLIADEATSAIDSLVSFQIMEVLQSLCASSGLAIIFITHDLALAKRYGSRIAVMSRGRMNEGMD